MWFSSAPKTKRKQVARPGRAKFRPCLEGLEDRCLLSAGALDPTFGNGAGYVTTSLGLGNSAASVLLQPDGKILAAGGETPSTGTGGDFAVTRYNQDGKFDCGIEISFTDKAAGESKPPSRILTGLETPRHTMISLRWRLTWTIPAT